MKLLELFSGTGSIGKIFKKYGHTVISVDIDNRFGCDIQEDILQFSYKELPWIPDVLWGSPPCTEYSRAKTRGIRKLDYADKLVSKFIEIKKYFLEKNPEMIWFCENGKSTLLWERQVSETLWPRIQVSYCQYGAKYQKNTTIATNIEWKNPKICDRKTCPMIVDGCHEYSAQQGPSKKKGILRKDDICSRDLLHSIPQELCEEIFQICTNKKNNQ